MKCQILFSGENKENNAEFAQKVVVKASWCNSVSVVNVLKSSYKLAYADQGLHCLSYRKVF